MKDKSGYCIGEVCWDGKDLWVKAAWRDPVGIIDRDINVGRPPERTDEGVIDFRAIRL